MKRFAIICIEIGMLSGIMVAAFTVPKSTPLLQFLIISGAFFLTGNILLFNKLRQIRMEVKPSDGKVWPHLFKVFAWCGFYWFVCFLFSRL
jgi:hypothetical protein